MKSVAVFMGTRPEGIKMAPVIAALRKADDLACSVVSTGQHREMLAQVVDVFGIDVDHDLAVMRPNQTLAGLTARLMTAVDELLEELKPDMALVQGDTTTVLVAALACFYRRIPIGHVEAGLRTGNIWSPFPEEVNRKLAAPIVTLHFPPTELGRRNLVSEGIDEASITVTGNTVIDALQLEVARQDAPEIAAGIHTELSAELGDDWATTPYVLVTGHRRENFGGGFEQICRALSQLAERFPEHRFVYPVHLNPQVKTPVHEALGGTPNVQLIEPKAYRPFVALMKQATVVLTDSGGVQEEAPSLGKPVLVMRDTTERPEGVDGGTVRLVGADAERIVAGVTELLRDGAAYEAMAQAVNPYGDGRAAGRIVDRIRAHFSGSG
jgi:UDP-N-acetylglucosamine 2-epimerase (non-hydrolysing)